jgi:hypothetical protein
MADYSEFGKESLHYKNGFRTVKASKFRRDVLFWRDSTQLQKGQIIYNSHENSTKRLNLNTTMHY